MNDCSASENTTNPLPTDRWAAVLGERRDEEHRWRHVLAQTLERRSRRRQLLERLELVAHRLLGVVARRLDDLDRLVELVLERGRELLGLAVAAVELELVVGVEDGTAERGPEREGEEQRGDPEHGSRQ
jgi:hypothetical protein